ncbi:MAG: hypothetical protein C4527_00360 [Candidatus Omnitrophota bacterium]|jgi:flagellar basal body-associated protein FliL|nr:MAG: hypothetical protein C4527_00360 [Candidatus Omnitrophota bacterium]
MGDPADQVKTEAQEEQQPKSKMLYILIIFIVILGIIGFVGMKMFSGSDEESPLPAIKVSDEVGRVYTFPTPFTVNLAPPDSERLLTCSISIEIKPRTGASEAEALQEMGIGDAENPNSKMPRILDLISEILQTKNWTDTKSQEGRNTIRTEIKTQLNFELKKAEIIRVNLTQMVVS